MSDTLDAVAGEASRDPSAPILERRMHGKAWRFGVLDVRPSKLRQFAAVATRLADRDQSQISDAEAIELSAVAEDMLRSALPPADRDAFDVAPFTGTDIAALIVDYFGALGADPGESSASPASSPSTAKRSRQTSPKRTAKR